MIFICAGNYFLESKCQQYTVSKVDVEGRWEYVSWFRKELLGVSCEPDEAKRLCESHQAGEALRAQTRESIKTFMESKSA